MKTECKTNRTMESSIEVVTLDSDEEQGAEGYEWPNTQPLYPPQNSIDEVSPPTYEHALLHSASNSLSAGVSPPEIQKTFVKKSEFSVPTNVFVPTKEPSVVCDPRLNPGLRREHSRVKVRGNRNGEHASKRKTVVTSKLFVKCKICYTQISVLQGPRLRFWNETVQTNTSI